MVQTLTIGTVRSERSEKSNFPIKCIYNQNFLNRKTVKYSQMHTIYLFVHIFKYIYINCLKWPPSESIQRAFFSKLLHLCSLQICWRAEGDHIWSWASPSSHIAYIVYKKNISVVKGMANMVANYVAFCKRWFDSISKFQSLRSQTLCGNVEACSILLKKIFFLCCNMLEVLLYCVLQNFHQVNFSIYQSINPYNRKTPTVNNAHPGHRLFTVSLQVFD